jgi:hypothetical protein
LWLVLPTLILCLFATFGRPPHAQEKAGSGTRPDQKAARTKIAAGEYADVEEGNSGAVGPFGEEVYNFGETWTLWRAAKDQYEIEGERRYESPRDLQQTGQFRATLSRDFTLLHITELARLRWRPDAGPLVCDFRPRELFCSASAREPIELRVPMQYPYAVLWPISPFSLGGLTREAERYPNRVAPVQFVVIEQPSSEAPLRTTILGGEMRYLGQEKLVTAGQTWPAFKFSFTAATRAPFLIWTSTKGLLLAVTVEHEHKNWPQEGIRLVRIEKSEDF